MCRWQRLMREAMSWTISCLLAIWCERKTTTVKARRSDEDDEHNRYSWSITHSTRGKCEAGHMASLLVGTYHTWYLKYHSWWCIENGSWWHKDIIDDRKLIMRTANLAATATESAITSSCVNDPFHTISYGTQDHSISYPSHKPMKIPSSYSHPPWSSTQPKPCSPATPPHRNASYVNSTLPLPNTPRASMIFPRRTWINFEGMPWRIWMSLMGSDGMMIRWVSLDQENNLIVWIVLLLYVLRDVNTSSIHAATSCCHCIRSHISVFAWYCNTTFAYIHLESCK